MGPLEELMKSTYLVLNDNKYALWDAMEQLQEVHRGGRAHFEDDPESEKAKTILLQCELIVKCLRRVSEPANILISLYDLLFERTLGYTDYVSLHLNGASRCGQTSSCGRIRSRFGCRLLMDSA